jgi:hypothetical protein
MRETRSYGSVRGAAGNSRPYREPRTHKRHATNRLHSIPWSARPRSESATVRPGAFEIYNQFDFRANRLSAYGFCGCIRSDALRYFLA